MEGTPDSNITDIGFHYILWNYVNAGDGNALSADLNEDDVVNFEDFAVLADYWQKATTEAADIDENGFVDYNDIDIMADEWLRVASVHPPITVIISDDPNNLTNDIAIGVNGYRLTTKRAFVLMDGKYVDELEYFDSDTPLLLETDNYINGEHSFKVVAIDANKNVTVSDTLETDFSNAFYSIIAPDYFYPTTDYNVWGFHNSSSSFEAKLTNHNDQILWSNTYSGQSVNIVIPGAAFGSAQLCEMSITETGSGIITTMGENGTAAASSGSGSVSKSLTKKFKREDAVGVKMLIITPTKDVFKRRKPALIACTKACDDRQVPWVHLYYRDVNEGNLTYLYNMDSVKYIYWAGHAGSHVGADPCNGIAGVPRTHTECWRYEPSWWHYNWQIIGAFSWTNGEVPLPDDWDNRGFSLWDLGMHDSWNKKLVFVDGCLSALPYMGGVNDMAAAYGMYSLQGQGSLDQVYIGWRIEVLTVPWWHIFDPILFHTDGVKLFWEKMGEEGYSVYNALEDTSDSSDGIKRALWGPNGEMNLFDIDGDDNIFVWGNGSVNLNQIRLEP